MVSDTVIFIVAILVGIIFLIIGFWMTDWTIIWGWFDVIGKMLVLIGAGALLGGVWGLLTPAKK